MKILNLILIFILICFENKYSQTTIDDFVCGTDINLDSLFGSYTPGGLENNLGVLQGGRLKTAQGLLKVLWVYVRFSDDLNVSNPDWPNPVLLPAFLQNSVNSSVPSNNNYRIKCQ